MKNMEMKAFTKVGLQPMPLKQISVLLLAYALSGCETMTAIDQGLYQVAEEITEIDRVTGERVVNMHDRKQQIGKGNKVIEEKLEEARAKGISYNEDFDPEGYQRIVRIFSRLHAVSHLRHEDWEPILWDDDTWNAFVTGGTYFVVFLVLKKI